jgi:adenylyltransferase and sulfurtransferase
MRRNHANTLLDNTPSLLLFSSLSTPPFRSVKLRSKQKDCLACSGKCYMNELDYVQFCGGPPINWQEKGQVVGSPDQRIYPVVCEHAQP